MEEICRHPSRRSQHQFKEKKTGNLDEKKFSINIQNVCTFVWSKYAIFQNFGNFSKQNG
jgi:hypothetical protein